MASIPSNRSPVVQPVHDEPRILSVSSEFPNPTEPGKGLFVRARLMAIAARTHLGVIAPVAMLDYANPRSQLFASFRIPAQRREKGIEILHPRWIYPPKGGWLDDQNEAVAIDDLDTRPGLQRGGGASAPRLS